MSMVEGDGEFLVYHLDGVAVMHLHHPLQNEPNEASSAVTLGFEWAEMPPDQGFFLCQCKDDCEDLERCGRTFFDDLEPGGVGDGHEVSLAMPWPDSSGPVVFDLWCCRVCEAVATGAVYDTWVGRFYDIPARLLSYEHEARRRNYNGLRRSLGERFPDEFSEASYVTVVLYRRTL